MNKSRLKFIIIIIFSIVMLLAARSFYRILTTKALDFGVLYTASKDLIAGRNPYQNEEIFTIVGYPPNSLLFFLPFTIFSNLLAQNIFSIASLFSLFGVIYLSLKLINKKIKWQEFALFSSFALLSFPVKFTFGMGQNNLLAFLLLLFSFLYYKKKKSVLAGIFLGVSVAFKTVFGIFFLFYLLKKKWKLLFSAGIVLLIFVGITAFISDIELYKYYVSTVIPPLARPAGKGIYYHQGIYGFVSRLISNLEIRKNVYSTLSIIFLAISAKLVKKKIMDENLQFSILIATLLLIDGLSWQHHFVWLIFPFIVLAKNITKKSTIKKLILLLAAYILFAWNFKKPDIVPVLLRSNQFYSAIILYYLLASKIQGRVTS